MGKVIKAGYNVKLDLVGPPDSALPKLLDEIAAIDPTNTIISYHGGVDHRSLQKFYSEADAGIFASSCENLPNILLESMAAALPMLVAVKPLLNTRGCRYLFSS